jgi:hypothetical protein
VPPPTDGEGNATGEMQLLHGIAFCLIRLNITILEARDHAHQNNDYNLFSSLESSHMNGLITADEFKEGYKLQASQWTLLKRFGLRNTSTPTQENKLFSGSEILVHFRICQNYLSTGYYGGRAGRDRRKWLSYNEAPESLTYHQGCVSNTNYVLGYPNSSHTSWNPCCSAVNLALSCRSETSSSSFDEAASTACFRS